MMEIGNGIYFYQIVFSLKSSLETTDFIIINVVYTVGFSSHNICKLSKT